MGASLPGQVVRHHLAVGKGPDSSQNGNRSSWSVSQEFPNFIAFLRRCSLRWVAVVVCSAQQFFMRMPSLFLRAPDRGNRLLFAQVTFVAFDHLARRAGGMKMCRARSQETAGRFDWPAASVRAFC